MIYAHLFFFSSMVYLYLSVLSWRLNSRAHLNRIFSAFTLVLSVWAFAYTFMLLAPDSETALFWRRVAAPGWCTFYAMFLHFVLVLTGKDSLLKKPWGYALLYSPAVLILANRLHPSGISAVSFVRTAVGWVFLPVEKGFWFHAFDVYYLSYILLATILVVHWGVKTKSSREKRQSRLIAGTVLTALLFGSFTDIYLPAYGVPIPPMAIALMLIPAFGNWRAITKYNMLVLTSAYAADHILKTMGDPVIVFGKDGKVTLANSAAENLLKYGAPDFSQVSVDRLFCDDMFQTLDQLTALSPLHNTETLITSSYGRQIPVFLSSTVICDEAYEVAGVVCIFHDITRRKADEEALRKAHTELEERVRLRTRELADANEALRKAHDELEKRVLERTQELADANQTLQSEIAERLRMEQEIRRSETKLRLLTDNMLDMICRIDAEGTLRYVSPSYKTILGHDVAELLGRSVFTHVHPEDASAIMAAYAKGVTEASINRFEFRGRHANGRYVWIESVCNFLFDNNGIFSGAIICSRDITDRKEMEEKLRFLSLFDSLTGLYNRNYFEQEMSRLESGRHNPVGILICDVDGLKLYNDSLGHEAGDRLLKDIGAVISNCFRDSDVVARVGGDEFAVLLPASDRKKVESISRRLRAAVEHYNAEHQSLPVSISVGYCLRECNSESLADVFRRADDIMYREKLHRSQSARSAVSQILKKSLEARDFITEGHADRMQKIVVAIAKYIGLSDHNISDLRLLAQFHDIGKVGISDTILFKPGPLTPDERLIMQRHSEIGHRIALSAPDLAPIADWILKHHEWWNGQGYPFGLAGEKIPLECRILAIADAYDAMTNDRPYRKAIPREQALDEIRRCAGQQFDPALVNSFLTLIDSGFLMQEQEAS